MFDIRIEYMIWFECGNKFFKFKIYLIDFKDGYIFSIYNIFIYFTLIILSIFLFLELFEIVNFVFYFFNF